MISSVRSVAMPELFLYQDTQMMMPVFFARTGFNAAISFSNSLQEPANKCTQSGISLPEHTWEEISVPSQLK